MRPEREALQASEVTVERFRRQPGHPLAGQIEQRQNAFKRLMNRTDLSRELVPLADTPIVLPAPSTICVSGSFTTSTLIWPNPFRARGVATS